MNTNDNEPIYVEYPILSHLLLMEQKLILLKNKEEMIPKDILPLEHEIEETIQELINIRGGYLFKENHVNNRTDEEVNKVCQLVSLCFMTVGKWHESPAIFSQVIAIKNCFYQLEQIGVYNEKNLAPYSIKLKQLEAILTEDCSLPKPILELVRYNYMICKRIHDKLLATIRNVSPHLLSVRDELLGIRLQLVNIAFEPCYNEEDVFGIQKKLLEIDNKRGINGFFFSDDHVLSLFGQGTVVDILETNFSICHDLLYKTPLVEIVRQQLIETRADLQRIELTSKWNMRQIDLFPYQVQLSNVAHMLHTKKQFKRQIGHNMLSYLLFDCYTIILHLIGDGPSVAESLLPVYHQLTTLRDCLKRLQGLHCSLSEDEMMMYTMKLKSIDIMRDGGIFYDKDGLIPEGQSKCVFTLEECYKLIQELSKYDEDSESDSNSQYKGSQENGESFSRGNSPYKDALYGLDDLSSSQDENESVNT